MTKELKQAITNLENFKGEKPRVSKTIFGEPVSADPTVVTQNSMKLAELTYDFFKALAKQQKKENGSYTPNSR